LVLHQKQEQEQDESSVVFAPKLIPPLAWAGTATVADSHVGNISG
jgi:hypothetical protein